MDGRTQEGDDFVSVEHDHEFLNTDKSNLALQTQYFTDSLKNFNDIAVHSKMMLELIAKRILGQPKVIPTVYLTDGDFSPPVDEVVAIRAMVMSTQTTPVVITVNGIIPMLVSTLPTQIVTGPISSVTVGNTVPGNPVYVQYLDERAALLSNTSTQDDVAVNGTVSLTGSLAPLTADAPTTIFNEPYSNALFQDASGYGSLTLTAVLHRNARARSFQIINELNQPLSSVAFSIGDSSNITGETGANWFNGTAGDVQVAGTIGVGASAEFTSENNTYLAMHFDSLYIRFNYSGTTLSTGGSVQVVMTEEF